MTAAVEREPWLLRLYVAGDTPRARAAVANLRRICDDHLPDASIEVVDLLEQPELARGEHVVAIPTLERRRPLPVRRIVGDLTNLDRVLLGLDLGGGDR